MIEVLKEKYGPYCLGLKIDCREKETHIPAPQAPLRFCEAVRLAFDKPLLIKAEDLNCPGSKRSMGLFFEDETLMKNIHQESGIDPGMIRKAVNDIPRLDKPPESILLGIDEEMEKEIRPDLFILFLQPARVMELMKLYALKLKQFPLIRPFSFMSVCGNVFVSTYKNRDFCISFGRPDSRKYAGLADDLVVAGIPYESCVALFS